MNRCIVIGVTATEQKCLGVGLTENEAMNLATNSTGFTSVEVYINPQPFSVVNCKPGKIAVKKTVKKSAKRKKAK